MEVWLNDLINWIPIGGFYYSLIGFLCFIDAVAFIGILYPGGFLVVVSGFLAANGKGDFYTLALVSAIGSIAGDLISYIIGARAGGAIMQRPWFKRRENLLKKAQIYFAGHGGKSVFVGRFVGFLRPFIPFIAGSARMNPVAFSLYALISGTLWGIITPGIGYFFGASWQMVQVWSGRFSLLCLFLVSIFLLNALFWRYGLPLLRKLTQLVAEKITSCWRKILSSPKIISFTNRYPRLWAFLCRRFDAEHVRGICLTSGFIISSLLTLLLIWFGRSIHQSGPLITFDKRLYELLAIFHHPWTDIFYVAVSWMGGREAMGMIGALALFTLIINNRKFLVLVFIFGIGIGEFFAFMSKGVFTRPQPAPLFPDLHISASSPSLHAFSALLFYGLLIYFILEPIRKNRRLQITLLLFGSCIIFLIGFSRIYLGVDWASDVLVGFTLAALWLTFLITLSETHLRHGCFSLPQGFRPITITDRTRYILFFVASIGTFTLIFTTITPYLHSVSLGRAQRLHQNIETPKISDNLPLTTESLWGNPLRPLNLIVIADEATLLRTLATGGWHPAEQVGLKGFRTLLIDLLQGRTPQDATIIPQLVDGQSQNYSFVHDQNETDKNLLLNLLVWDLGRRIPDGRTVWGLLVSQQIGIKHLSLLPLPLPLTASAGSEEETELETLFSSSEARMTIKIIFPKE